MCQWIRHATAFLTLAFLSGMPMAWAQSCPFGKDQCKFGYVWREAYAGDHVCVTGTSRNQAFDDNKNGPSRKAPGSDNCKFGWVWREANASDHVCVTGTIRNQTRAENAAAPSLVDPACAGSTNTPTCQQKCAAEKAECVASQDPHRNCGREYSQCVGPHGNCTPFP